jgi:uncharacterized protein YjiK
MLNNLSTCAAALGILILLGQCSPQKPITPLVSYNLDVPNKTFKMPAALREISGLSMSHNPQKLAAIQDETGYLYFIDKQSGSVDPNPIFFLENGDFESVEIVGDTAYVAKSKGVIIVMKGIASGRPTIQQINTPLTKNDNIEGLCYDAKTNSLWLAAKGLQDAGEKVKKVYAFDLKTMKLNPQPVLTLKLEKVAEFLTRRTDARYDKLKASMQPYQELELGFSGIAIHPKTGEIYLLSSINKAMIVMNRQNTILDMVKLDKNIHAQPEGICFDNDGKLFISNEAKGDIAKIHVFSPQ